MKKAILEAKVRPNEKLVHMSLLLKLQRIFTHFFLHFYCQLRKRFYWLGLSRNNQVFGDWVEGSVEVCKGIPPWENSCLIPTIKTVERLLQIVVLFCAVPNEEKHFSTFSVLEPFLIVPIVAASNGLVVKAQDFQSRGPVFKTTGWFQGRLSLSSFRGR